MCRRDFAFPCIPLSDVVLAAFEAIRGRRQGRAYMAGRLHGVVDIAAQMPNQAWLLVVKEFPSDNDCLPTISVSNPIFVALWRF